ncbi:uncharacterized protein NECHADRAFT_61287 [Fusarium vanettenii 77-13-4]|uniref:Uncharacterized protein n=1 Tax=Fusarium vanettenii (strain ATCC MYA-4622 / CBS 123669 / FGSC 9596 / NRRL 45880 / 77-13-4) TaxID=660122 RepID=C7YRX5_FUSV7|nr:uncharacterized protein NECHADRAFT_61287 [Fusarium vanettenii 77-13-4]EEU45146.1 hypothetical protein NECHADRAFT_61287 [Fusarium vanettenii 77-13-4]
MHSMKLLSAIAAIGVSAVSGATTCTKDVKVTQPTPVIDCKVIDANLIIDKSVAGEVVITGPEEITGDFIANDASKIISLSSSSITTIGGKLSLESLEALQTLQMDALTDVGELSFITLPRLGTLVFGTKGVTKISAIRISDTYLSDLSGLSVAAVDSFQIDNNRKITAFNSDLVNVTKELLIFDNGNNMDITMNKLEVVAEVQISNAKNFEVPALERVTKSLKFTSNPELKSLAFPNLTKVSETISFVDMNKLTNISFPALETIGGGLAIENNTKLIAIDDLPKLKTVYGGISLRGNFEKVELPKLDTVSGTVVVTSTTDIKDFCQFFKDLKDDGKIEGEETCTWDNPEANEGGNGGESDTKSGSSSDSKDEEDAAGILNVNMVSLAAVGLFAVAQLL